MPRSRVCALVLAAGLSTRMRPLLGGKSKALCVLEGVSLLSRCCSLFKRAGIEGVYVVTGHDHEEVARAAFSLGAVPVYNENYTNGMFSSVTAGLKALMEDAAYGAFFLLPVDTPLVSPEIIVDLQKYWQDIGEGRDEAIILPVAKSMPGHPPLIGCTHWPDILAWKGEKGLQGYIGNRGRTGFRQRQCVHTVPVDEAAILWDIDTPEDLEQARLFAKNTGE